MRTDKEALLLKIKALADRGVGGEAETAAILLDRLMAKYGITEEDLSDEVAEIREFRYSKPFEDKLIDQIAYMVIGKYEAYRYTHSKAKVKLVKCTKAQQIEIEAAFEFYKGHLAEGLQKYFTAFIVAEGIMPDDTKEKDEDAKGIDPSELLLAAVLDKHERRAAITDGKGAKA